MDRAYVREWDARVDPPMAWLIRANRQAIVARLLAATVHDVSNSLQVVSGAAEMLAMESTPDVAKRTTTIVGQAMAATRSLQALTGFERDAGQAAGRVRLEELAARALTLRRYPMRKLKIDASHDGDGDVVGVARSLLQVVLNLVMNAEQALARTTGATLRLTAAADDEWGTLTVRDNGPGLTPEDRAKAFLWPPPSNPEPGTLGIGLLVSRALMADAGGTLCVEADPSGGTVATVRVPRLRG